MKQSGSQEWHLVLCLLRKEKEKGLGFLGVGLRFNFCGRRYWTSGRLVSSGVGGPMGPCRSGVEEKRGNGVGDVQQGLPGDVGGCGISAQDCFPPGLCGRVGPG